MKSLHVYLLLILLQLTLCVFNSNAQTEQNRNAEVIVNKILSDSEKYYKEGELNLKDNRIPQAMEKFDKAIEVFLFSAINVKRNQKVNESYLKLIDKIHQLEMSAKNKPAQNKNFDITASSVCSKTSEDNKTKREINTTVNDSLIQALNSYKNQDYDSSVSSLRKVLAAEPMNSLAYLLMGKIYSRTGDVDQAIISLKTALFWDNRDIEAHVELVRILVNKRDISQAKSYLRIASDIEPENPKIKALNRWIEIGATADDKKIIEQDVTEIENWTNKLTKEKTGELTTTIFPRNLMFVAPFQSATEKNWLGQDFSYVLSSLLAVPGFCAVSYDKGKNLLDSFGIEPEESFTLATALKLAMTIKASILVVGKYEINKRYIDRDSVNAISATAKIVEVNEGRFLSEEFSDGKRLVRYIIIEDAAENLRTLQGQIAFQILYQQDKILPFTQREFTEIANDLKIPRRISKLLGIRSANYGELDFSIKNSLQKTVCSASALNNLQLRGFRLGMTFNEILKILPKAPIKNISSSEKQVSISPKMSLIKNPGFKDINSITLNFLDNNLYSIGIIYDDTIKWNSLDEFSTQVEKTLGLPKIKSDDNEFDGNYLFCGNYQLKIMFSTDNTPAIHLFDTTIFEKIERRKKEELEKALQKKIEEEKQKRKVEEEKKKIFKP